MEKNKTLQELLFSAVSDNPYNTYVTQFLSSHWPEVSIIAAAQYAKIGRCVQVITMQDVNRPELIALPLKTVVSLLDHSVFSGYGLVDDGLSLAREVIQHIEAYNPDNQMVLWFSLPENNELYLTIEMYNLTKTGFMEN
ncbi:MAG: hypothetical protein QNJ46_15460 [Leptolyngbyaceae cyanobacterium MO_188.B28]|nr:hypothetical protein [Leptolyngbyaceae cyanobacterium MO_188.B28]